MKKILILMMACLLIGGWNTAGSCRAEDDAESGIEESESEAGQGLDSEMAGNESEAESEVEGVEESMDTGSGS